MREVIIKIFSTKEEFDDISLKVAKVMSECNAVLKSVGKEDEKGYSNEIYQIGNPEPFNIFVKPKE